MLPWLRTLFNRRAPWRRYGGEAGAYALFASAPIKCAIRSDARAPPVMQPRPRAAPASSSLLQRSCSRQQSFAHSGFVAVHAGPGAPLGTTLVRSSCPPRWTLRVVCRTPPLVELQRGTASCATCLQAPFCCTQRNERNAKGTRRLENHTSLIFGCCHCRSAARWAIRCGLSAARPGADAMGGRRLPRA